MLGNIIMLSILIVIMYVITKVELELIRQWFNFKSEDFGNNMLKFLLFWKNLLKNPIRFLAVVVILICQNGIVGIIISIIILSFIVYYFANNDVLEINWEDKNVQKIATFLMADMAVIWVLIAIF